MAEFLIEGDVNLAASRILVPIAVATVLPGVVQPISGTVVTADGGTVVIEGNQDAPASQDPVTDNLVVNVATVESPLEIGTVDSPVAVVGTVGFAPDTYAFTRASATIVAGPTVLRAIALAGEYGATAAIPGTLLVLDGAGTSAATVCVVPVAAGGFQNPQFGPNGIQITTGLIASLIGSVDVTFVHS